MRSDVVKITNGGSGMPEALDQVERAAAYKSLSEKDTIRLRLLAEEMMGMFRAITGEAEADFWLESEGLSFVLHLESEVEMTDKKRDKLLSISTSGTNLAAKGLMGKIRELFARAIEPSDDNGPAIGLKFMPSAPSMAHDVVTAEMWSLSKYKSSIDKKDTEKWDELEKSVVAKIADEVKIAIRGSKVEILVYKDFSA